MQKLVGVDAGAQGDDAAASRKLPLSICIFTRGRSSRLPSLMAQLRHLAAEIVVALDDRAEAEADSLTAVADQVVLFPHRDPGDSAIPWLHAQCQSEWIFNVDDDEVPSRALLLELPELLAADVTHWWLPRRWLFGSVATFLDEPPWVPDYQLRLYRNDPATLHFSDQFHRPVVASGPAGFARSPLWHLDCLLNTFEQRRDKALAYERARRGMRVAGLAHNSGFYLPELRADARRGRVPAEDAATIGEVLTSAPADGRLRVGMVRRAFREEVDAFWPGEPHDPTLYASSLSVLERVDAMPVEAQHTVTARIANESRVTWPSGHEASPLIMVGTRWLDPAGELVEEGMHTPLPADLPPSICRDVPVHVRAPAQPGRYRLSVDLVHEHVRWFGKGVEWEVDVVPAQRVALIGRGEALEETLDRIHLEPELEPVVLPSLSAYLLAGIEGSIGPLELAKLATRTAKLQRRARHARRGKPHAPLPDGVEECVLILARCTRLIASPDWSEDAAVTRHLWRLAATIRAARTLGLAVEVSLAGFVPKGIVDRVLTRIVIRTGQ